MGTEEHIEDLQATSHQVSADAERIAELEARKRKVDPGSADFRSLSSEIKRAADHVGMVSRAERQLAEEIAEEPDLPTIGEADGAER